MNPMQRALELARLSLGSVSPNPAVGAVVVRGGKIVGEGRTQPPGGHHAEVVALRRAGSFAIGAELFISLEPCSRFGRTPPCTDAIAAAGITRVHIGAIDPNPAENGRGIKRLREAGVEASVLTDDREARAANRIISAYRKHSLTETPYVTSKFAMSLDGKIATHSGSSMWITGELARARSHELRSESDAILVGIGTVISDDPSLTVRLADSQRSDNQPLRVIVDSSGVVPVDATVVRDGGRTLIACAKMDGDKGARLTEDGIEIETLPLMPGDRGHLDLHALMRLLGSRGITSVLLEGGGGIVGSFFDAGLVDRVAAFVAPVILGGKEAPGPVGGSGVGDVADALRLRDCSWEMIGSDMLVVGHLD